MHKSTTGIQTPGVQLPLISHGDQLLIDAKLLHQNLQSPSRFREWITYRIKEYNFEPGVDYFAEKIRKMGLGRKEVNYHLTLDMAKELAMLERNEVGRRIRRYFIQAERASRASAPYTPLAPLKGGHDPFKSIHTRRINDRMMLPYREVLRVCGYSDKASSSSRKDRYWMHFVKEGSVLWITRELAEHLYLQRSVYANRLALRSMQAVIPMDFGNVTGLKTL